MSVASTTDRLPSLDGWRALSILMVVAAHTKHTYDFPVDLDIYFKWLFDGDLGVRTFFIISGLLITFLLLKEEKTKGTVDLPSFYIRRILRIWPVYFTFLIVLLLLGIFATYSQSTLMWIGNITFMTNYFGAKWTNGHLWSLAVEEQFYFLWPIILKTTRRKKYLVGLLAIPFIIAPISRVVTYLQPSSWFLKSIFCGYSFFNYWDSIAIGCLAALCLSVKQNLLKRFVSRAVWFAPIFILAPYILSKLFLFGHFTVSVGPIFQAFGICILILHTMVNQSTTAYRYLNGSFLVKIGILSYSIYIWQMIFCSHPADLGVTPSWLFSWKTWLLPVFLVAISSYYFLERPFLRLRRRFHST